MHQPNILSDRAKKLLACAEKLFLEHGYQGTSLQMLIEQSGGSRRTVYAEFGNKEALFKAVLQQKVNQVNLLLSNIDEGHSVHENLVKVCQSFLHKLLEPDMLTLFRLLIRTTSDIPEIGQMMSQHVLIEGPQGLTDYLQQLQAKQLIQIQDPQLACHLLLGMVKGHLHMHAMLDPGFIATEQQIQQNVTQAVELFLNGVATEKTKPRIKVTWPLQPPR
ncbi:TetR/AcrR family transcriptional regulator [Paraglaciecola aestuariivivens]